MSPCIRMIGRMQMTRMQMRRVRTAEVLHKKTLALPTATLTGVTALVARLNRASQEMGRMVPLGETPHKSRQ